MTRFLRTTGLGLLASALLGLLLAFAPAASRAQGDWRFCAPEGAVCQVDGPATVRFGVDGRYAFRTVTGPIACTLDEFGDPAPHRPKGCEVSREGRRQGPYPEGRERWRGDAGNWRWCASEGEVCALRGPATVRFGTAGRYVVRQVGGTLRCSLDDFGQDPYPGVPKQCEVDMAGGGGGHAAPGPVFRPDTGGRWSECALEGGYCRVRGEATVRFGVSGRYVYRQVRDGIDCDLDAFGEDPFPHRPKRCEVQRR
jgi:hypothetical protein